MGNEARHIFDRVEEAAQRLEKLGMNGHPAVVPAIRKVAELRVMAHELGGDGEIVADVALDAIEVLLDAIERSTPA